jgi:molecular chaperone DnaK (HSP70)
VAEWLASAILGNGPTAPWSVLDAGGQLFPEEVSGYVLAKLLEVAEEFCGQQVSKAVISVPAYFNDAQVRLP